MSSEITNPQKFADQVKRIDALLHKCPMHETNMVRAMRDLAHDHPAAFRDYFAKAANVLIVMDDRGVIVGEASGLFYADDLGATRFISDIARAQHAKCIKASR